MKIKTAPISWKQLNEGIELNIPITDEIKPKYRPYGKNDKFTSKVTIYNDIASDGVNPRRFDRFVIDKCLVYTKFVEGDSGSTIGKIIDSQNVVSRDIEHYKSPIEYKRLPADEKEKYYTVQINDFVVLSEVDDVVTTSREFQALQEKYSNGLGFSVTAVTPYLKGTNTNNIHIMHA